MQHPRKKGNSLSELQRSSTKRKPSTKELQFSEQKIQGLSMGNQPKTNCLKV